ncbi:hypothetical protein CLOM_g7228, partial [Closterium sp. NIES-68]
LEPSCFSGSHGVQHASARENAVPVSARGGARRSPLHGNTGARGNHLYAAVLPPLKSFCQHVNTWAHYAQSPGRMIETHHLVSRLTEDVLQCIVFDSDQANARIIGVEYIVAESVFKKLPEEEKHLWHSHYYEICEGLWVNPGVPEVMQQQELKKLVKTYGKFWNTWQFDRGDLLPLGPPALMLSPQDHPLGRVPCAVLEQRDAGLGIETGEKQEQRETVLVDKEWAATGKDRAADWWMESGTGPLR